MTAEQLASRRSYEAAAARYRSAYERYFPLDVLGSRAAQPLTPEAELDLARLEAERNMALAQYEALGGRPRLT
jgi:hypothetical protein